MKTLAIVTIDSTQEKIKLQWEENSDIVAIWEDGEVDPTGVGNFATKEEAVKAIKEGWIYFELEFIE